MPPILSKLASLPAALGGVKCGGWAPKAAILAVCFRRVKPQCAPVVGPWWNHSFTIGTLMRAVVQRVRRASVEVAGAVVGEIGPGLLVLLGVAQDDTDADAAYLADKVAGLRIFEDGEGKMNLAAAEVGGAVLAVSQFTLLGDVRRGKRPSFDAAARPEQARRLYEVFVQKIRDSGLCCAAGRFQEMMDVELVNEGPVTI